MDEQREEYERLRRVMSGAYEVPTGTSPETARMEALSGNDKLWTPPVPMRPNWLVRNVGDVPAQALSGIVDGMKAVYGDVVGAGDQLSEWITGIDP